VLVFLATVGLSILVSADIGRSMRLSASLLPGTLLFFVVADHLDDIRDMRLLYMTFSIVALGLGLVLLWTAWKDGWVSPLSPRTWVLHTGSPILIVPNDVTFLAVVTPLSLALLYQKPWSAVGLLAALSILLSVCVMSILLSGVAILTMIIGITCTAALVQPRFGIACALMILTIALVIDGIRGFPLVAKFGYLWDEESRYIWYGEPGRILYAESGRILYGRIPVWLAAWAMFLTAPVLGHGPHTFFYLGPDGTSMRWPHNLYLELLAEQGLIGLAALGFLLVAGISAAWHLQRAARSDVHILGAGALAGLVSFCFAALLELSLLRRWVVIILFALLGITAQLSSLPLKVKEGSS